MAGMSEHHKARQSPGLAFIADEQAPALLGVALQSGIKQPTHPECQIASDAPHMPLVLPLQNGCLGKSANAA